MTRSTIIEGGCLCGAVRYRAGGEASHPTLVSLQLLPTRGRSARRRLGDVSARGVRFHEGSARAPSLVAARRAHVLPELRHAAHVSALRTTQTKSTSPIASLDDPSAFPPADHTWTSERIAWLELGDRLPRHERSRLG